MERIFTGIFLLILVFCFLSCGSTKKNENDSGLLTDSDNETAGDADAPRVLTQLRMLGEGGFFGISASAGNAEYFAVGAHYADITATPGENPSGKVYLFKKGVLPNSISATSQVLTHPDKRAGSGFGYTIGGYCDINCDGRPDFAVSAHLDSIASTPNCGTIAIFYGGENPVPASAVLSLPDSVRKQSDVIGQSLICYDIDNDGCDDIIAGGQNAGSRDTGLIAVWKGSSSGAVPEPALLLEGQIPQNKQYLGASLARGDVDGDGIADLIAGGWGLKKTADAANTGGVYLYKGGSDWSKGPSSVLFPDEALAMSFGAKAVLFSTGSVTYLAVLASKYKETGAVFIYTFASGSFTLVRKIVPSENDPKAADLADIDFTPDFGGKGKGAILTGHKYYGADSTGALMAFPFPDETGVPVLITAQPPVSGDTLGAMIKDVGDINGDGLSDFIAGTPEHIEGTIETGTQPGGIIVFY